MSKKGKITDTRPFSERHPRWNFFIGLLLFFGMIAGAIAIVYYVVNFISHIVSSFVDWISTVATTLDAVVIVALITGSVSIVGVIISSIVAKSLEYRKARREYLTQKREKPYGEFVDMVYKIQQNGKNGNKYTQDEMIKDLMTFSKEITLWGSPSVVNKWVKFKENGMKNTGGLENVLLTEEIMNAMRKDLGLRKVKKGNLLSFFINDIKDAMKGAKK